jgi:hypothetical protein
MPPGVSRLKLDPLTDGDLTLSTITLAKPTTSPATPSLADGVPKFLVVFIEESHEKPGAIARL